MDAQRRVARLWGGRPCRLLGVGPRVPKRPSPEKENRPCHITYPTFNEKARDRVPNVYSQSVMKLMIALTALIASITVRF